MRLELVALTAKAGIFDKWTTSSDPGHAEGSSSGDDNELIDGGIQLRSIHTQKPIVAMETNEPNDHEKARLMEADITHDDDEDNDEDNGALATVNNIPKSTRLQKVSREKFLHRPWQSMMIPGLILFMTVAIPR
jgi:hypothetical protein